MNDFGEIEKVFKNSENLSPLQKEFQKKITAINILKNELEELTKNLETCSLEYRQTVEPLQKEYYSLVRQRLFLLASIYLESRLSKSLKRNLSEVIGSECKAILSNEEDKEVQELYERCCHIEYPENEYEQEEAKSFNFFEEESDYSWEKKTHEHSNSKKSSRAKLKSDAKEDAKKEARKRSIKSIYKDLIKVFHPDKEMDESKKIEKEEISKKLTEAYSKNDLFSLLQLELMYMETNKDRLKELVNEKLKIYNEILEEQKSKLDFDIQALKTKFGFIYKGMCSKHSNKNKFLKNTKTEWRERNAHLKEQLSLLEESDEFLKYFVSKYLDEVYREG